MNEFLQLPAIFGSLVAILTPHRFEFVIDVVAGPAELLSDLSPIVPILFHEFYQPFLFLGRPLAFAIIFVELPLDEAVAAERSPPRQSAGEDMEKLLLFEEGVDNVLLIEEDEEVLITYMYEGVLISR